MRSLILSLVLLAPLLTGCLSEDADAPQQGGPVARSATEAGASSGEAPVAPREAYAVSPGGSGEAVTAHPVLVATNPAKPPVELDFSDVFERGDCRGLNFGETEPTLRQVSNHRRFHDLTEHLAVGDVFQYEILFSVTNKDASWGEIHPSFGMGSTIRGHDESVGQTREPVVVNWTGQGFRASDADLAWVFVGCQFGVVTDPIPYTLTVKLTFAEGAVPAEAPMLLPVPAEATRMFVRGVPFDASRGVMSHFRLFGPDDALLCECALSSGEEVAVVPLTQAGDHVLLVDHTDNGFVSVAFDAPPEGPLEALPVEWARASLLASGGGAVDQTVEVDLPKVPLFMHAMVLGPEDKSPGLGRKTSLSLENGRGEPLRIAWGGHLAMRMDDDGRGMWLGMWPGDWDYAVDHHAFAPGKHVAHVKSDALRGEVVLMTRQYVR